MARAQGGAQSKDNATEASSSFSIPATMKDQRSTAIEWVLRELRPVSFSFKKGTDHKTMGESRYGFVAQEVERVVPDIVHNGEGDTKYMMYQDMIAMITLAAQDHQEKLESHGGEVNKLRSLVKRLADKLSRLQQRVIGLR